MMIFHKPLVSWPLTSALLLVSGSVWASGFALIEQSGSGLGNAFAGGAAGAEDAATIFFNPAGMARLNDKQVVVAGSIIKPTIHFTDSGASTAATLQTAGGDGGDAGSWALVPNAYFALELNPQTRVGVGINAPFGLQTEYNSDWKGRFQAIKSKIQTVNLNPSLSYDVNQMLSLGAGLNYQYITGDLTSAVNYSAAAFSAGGSGLLTAIGGPNQEGVSTITGDDSAWGYNVGALINIDPHTRIGLAYRSKIKYTLSGTVSFDNVPPALASSPLLANSDVTLPIDMPDSFSISGFHQLNSQWDLMADATWTGWGVFKQLKIDRTNGANVQTVDENWKNTWRFSTGANYHYNQTWLARAGVALDQAPVPDSHRTARIPDNDRLWLALGGQYKPSANDALDFGYAHLFVKDSTIADMQAASGRGDLVGNYENSVDILSVQYTRSF
ncbi:MAG: outer membrane protein transport protein [Pseudomonadota bacterium]|nr:outer membrane protein transport protein [Pseudomonadota bacterium]